MTANNRFHNYYWLLIKQIPSDQLRSIKRVQICIEVAHSSGPQSLCLHTTIPIWHTFYLLQLMLQQSIYFKMASLTPVACSFQSAAKSAKSLHSIVLCNKSHSCFFRANLSSLNLWASWNASPHLASTLATLLFGWQRGIIPFSLKHTIMISLTTQNYYCSPL